MNAAPVLKSAQDGPRSGLLALRNMVAMYFADNAVPAIVGPVGLKYRSFQLQAVPNGANRVVFIPGEFDGDGSKLKPRKYGSLSRANRNHASVQNPRELLSWERPITLSIWSGPQPGQTADEGLNLALCEDFLEQTVRAVNAYAAASVVWGNVVINAPPIESAFGAELLVSLLQVGPIFDVSYEYVQANIVPSGTLT